MVTSANAGVEQITHYYPFGTSFADGFQADKQQYKYNGKELEKQFGLESYDYHARQMDAQIGRFTSVDPHAENYYGWSPYVYVLNNPMKYIDPNGMDVVNAHEEEEKEARRQANEAGFAYADAIRNQDTSTRAGRKALSDAERTFNRATNSYATAKNNNKQTQEVINEFKRVDPNGFEQMDNATYTDKNGNIQKVDILVSSGTLNAGINGGQTQFRLYPKNEIIYGSNQIENNINVTIDRGGSPGAERLAHEFGHVSQAIENPRLYYNEVAANPRHNCQDPKHTNHPISKRALEWQYRYRRNK